MASITKMSNSMASIAKMSNSITSIDRSRVGCASDHSNIVRMSSGISISNWKSCSNLSNGVSIRVSLSLTLAVVSGISIVSIGNRSSISKVASISKMATIHSTITKSTDNTHQTMAIVNTSYNTSVGVSSCNLANGVGVTVSIDSSERQDDKDKSSHDDDAG